jgi:hypothetical protein
MTRARVVMEDQAGQPIGEERIYELEEGSRTLAEIEGAVERFRRAALVEEFEEFSRSSESE